MLGLGNAITSTSVVGGPLSMSILELTADQLSDSQSVQVRLAVAGADNLATLQGFAAANQGGKLGGTYSLKIDRYDALIASGGTVQATKTLTVFAYRNTNFPYFYSFLSDDDSANIGMNNFSAEGSALLNFQDLDGTDITAQGSHLYVFTLTISGAGYLDAVKSSSEITIDT